eukprot:12156455-Heterocapsa_arctica.AAC.1
MGAARVELKKCLTVAVTFRQLKLLSHQAVEAAAELAGRRADQGWSRPGPSRGPTGGGPGAREP